MSEQGPVQKIAALGDNPEFREVYETHFRKIRGHIAYLTGNRDAAEDLAQEAFIRLFDSPPEHGNVLPWLLRVATNLSLNHLRAESARKGRERIMLEDESDNVISIEDSVIRNQEIRQARKALDSLPERDRICLLLKFSGCRYGEIAEMTGVEKGSMGTTLARAQAKFKKKYNREVRE